MLPWTTLTFLQVLISLVFGSCLSSYLVLAFPAPGRNALPCLSRFHSISSLLAPLFSLCFPCSDHPPNLHVSGSFLSWVLPSTLLLCSGDVICICLMWGMNGHSVLEHSDSFPQLNSQIQNEKLFSFLQVDLMGNQKLILIFVFLVLYLHKSTDSFMYNFSNLQLKILILFILFCTCTHLRSCLEVRGQLFILPPRSWVRVSLQTLG